MENLNKAASTISILHQCKVNTEVLKIKEFFEQVRKPQNNISLNKQIAETVGIILLGFALGVFQKRMDGAPDNAFLVAIQQFDVGNYFGRLAIWILLATIISVYAKSPLRAAINTFFFFISMLAGYYLYCNYILGFLPRTYMMMWIVIAFASFFMAYICWYAKGEGIIAIVLGYFGSALGYEVMNWPQLGPILAIVVMGAAIITSLEKDE